MRFARFRRSESTKILNWAHQLGSLVSDQNVEWSGTWSDEDVADATAASIRHFDDSELEQR